MSDQLLYNQTAWSLNDLFSAHDSPELKATLERLEGEVAAFEARRTELAPDISPETFQELVRQMEEIYLTGYPIAAYASLWFSADTQDPAAQNFMAQVDQLIAGLQNRVLFFSLWWKGLPDPQAERLLAISGEYRYWLEAMRKFRPHTLTEPEEKVINLKNVTGVNALNTIYSMLTNRYVFRLEVGGEVKELTRDGLLSYVRSPDPDLRAQAYQEITRVYAADNAILGQIYQNIVRDWYNEQMELRKFGQPIAARNLDNDVPDVVVETLLEVCRKNAPLFQRFFRLKARWLGLERLRRFDIYAPVVRSEKTYAFPQAAGMVLDAFGRFDPRLPELAKRVFAENHLDSQVRPGKRGGAFCSSVIPSLTPWVLVNYQGRASDVATLAHELGHAIHSMLASQHNLFTWSPSLPLAETASTFGEMLLVDRLLAQESDEQVRRDLLFRQVDDAYASIQRQAFFALFERQAHEMVKSGASVGELAQAYLENLREQFGEAVEVDEEFRWEWISIPHIYAVPFYVYAYAFGQLLVLALYQQYRSEGETFKPRYLKILSAGGSDSPARILADAGIDIHAAAFWQGGFDVLQSLVEQLEAIPVG